MSLAPSPHSADKGFAIEDISTGLHASGFGQLDGGRSFSFHVEHGLEALEAADTVVVPGWHGDPSPAAVAPVARAHLARNGNAVTPRAFASRVAGGGNHCRAA